MTFTEKYKLKLKREKGRQAEIQARKEAMQAERIAAKAKDRGKALRERYREARSQLLRIQGYRCGICKRDNSDCGKRKLRADCFEGQLVRGLLCQRCNRLLSEHNNQPLVIAANEKLPFKIRRNAVEYLEHWPSQKLDYFLYRQRSDLKSA